MASRTGSGLAVNDIQGNGNTIPDQRNNHRANVPANLLPQQLVWTITNAAETVKTASLLAAVGNTLLATDFPNLQLVTTGGGLTYTVTYKAGLAALQSRLKKEQYKFTGFFLDCGSDANAATQYFQNITKVTMKNNSQVEEPLNDMLIIGKSGSSFKQQQRVLAVQFEANDITDILFDIIPGGSLQIVANHIGSVTNMSA